MPKKINKPEKSVKVFRCSKCGELLAKFYPNHSFNIQAKGELLCRKCMPYDPLRYSN